MPTIKDVAKEAGVSIATVSRVVNNGPKVGDATRARVLQIMQDIGYRPNANARALVMQKEASLGVVIPELTDPFYASLASGVDTVARQHNMQLLLSTGLIEASTERAAIELLLQRRCDAMIVHSKFMSDDELTELAVATPGMVFINRYLPDIPERCIWLDNIAGGKLAARHLLVNGHTNLACITSDYSIDDPMLRLQGFKEELGEAGVSLREEAIEYGAPGQLGGELATQALLAKNIPFTGIFAYNDSMAAGVIKALHDAGLKVPQDVSVVGFDDVLLSRYVRPQLSTMRYPIERMAINAAELALSLVGGHPSELHSTNKYLPTLVKRESSSNASLS
ncbi:LacI family DNA-binding transcriptional regulator [Echinimonas agarilytica]|uniref:LacI family DNA-binding transcriptional regulator n=1 Tax=Echinimonas agarilytica TaxID=1215918 RepID=A0AA41W4X8_9GAMM|nr:LacI family DNA-binding transcriptional regulator [Echinimonas agarilytica]MCM2679047.1 LacI family DNA-binding transcriptional regulator [Echinimonas agarilytica]